MKRLKALEKIFDIIFEYTDTDSISALCQFYEFAKDIKEDIFNEIENPTENYWFNDFIEDYKYFYKKYDDIALFYDDAELKKMWEEINHEQR